MYWFSSVRAWSAGRSTVSTTIGTNRLATAGVRTSDAKWVNTPWISSTSPAANRSIRALAIFSASS